MWSRIQRDLVNYQKAHKHKANQVLHYFAFLFAFLGWIFLFINIYVTIILALLHYTFSWIGHFYYEKNKPASFKYPLLGFYAGFLWFFLLTFQLLFSKRVLPPLD
ncbi:MULTISPECIES: Mpo1-like protein [Bacillus]|uniref:Mpo1-like protein n=1 Tax=Bacillus TaxID=1386 RepID=UPI000BB9AD3A|nr:MULTISPECIES: Mpo1-like protein [Bacillus]